MNEPDTITAAADRTHHKPEPARLSAAELLAVAVGLLCFALNFAAWAFLSSVPF